MLGADQLLAGIGSFKQANKRLGHLVESFDEMLFVLEGSVLNPFTEIRESLSISVLEIENQEPLYRRSFDDQIPEESWSRLGLVEIIL